VVECSGDVPDLTVLLFEGVRSGTPYGGIVAATIAPATAPWPGGVRRGARGGGDCGETAPRVGAIQSLTYVE